MLYIFILSYGLTVSSNFFSICFKFLIPLYETDYIDEVEKCLKNVLSTKQYKKRKEFYEIDIDILKELIKTCDKMSLKVRKNNKNIKQTGGYYIMLDTNL